MKNRPKYLIEADATDEEKAGVKATLLDRQISLKKIY